MTQNQRTDIVMIGDLEVVVVSTVVMHTLPPSVEYVATCGKAKPVKSVMAPHPRHDRLPEHMEGDHNRCLMAVAKEAAGHERTRLLLEGWGKEPATKV